MEKRLLWDEDICKRSDTLFSLVHDFVKLHSIKYDVQESKGLLDRFIMVTLREQSFLQEEQR